MLTGREGEGEEQEQVEKAKGSDAGKKQRKGHQWVLPDRQEDSKGLPYLVIKAVVPDSLNIHFVYMPQHI